MSVTTLIYHSINDRADLVAGGAALPVARFFEHIKFIAKSGRTPATLASSLHPGATGIAVTFDDGDADVFETALPILQKFGVPATVFVSSSLLDTEWVDHGLKRRMLTTSQLQSLAASPLIEIGSHAHVHAPMVLRSRADLLEDLSLSKQMLETIVGKPVRYLAYPHGSHNAEVMEVAKQVGFEAGFACMETGGSRFALPRISVSRLDTVPRLRVKLFPGYRPARLLATRLLSKVR